MKAVSRNPQSAIRNPQSVFVVDDDPSVRKGLSRLLQSAGYEVETFPSARAFLDRPQSAIPNPQSESRNPPSPSCLILDVQMPGLNGLDLQEKLGGGEDSMPIIFITGHGDIPMSVRAMKKGAVDFLAKPFDRRDLLAAISVALSKDRAARQRRAKTQAIRDREQTLTPCERGVMARVIAGLLNKQIAAELGIEEGTVKVHRGRVMTKMGVQSVAELVKLNAEIGT
jgi:FixJ family two-component response regulator